MPIMIDGVSYKLEAPDVDGDGKRGGVEVLRNSNLDMTPIMQPTELGETLKDFNKDDLDPSTNMSSIDVKTRIFNSFERNCLMSVDSLVAMKFLPLRCLTITRQVKRLNVSMKGEGRKEIVEIVAGKREHDKQAGMGGMMQGIKNMLPGGGGSSN